MAAARAFSVLYNLVATIAQDTSATGLTNAQSGINTIIKELTREFRLPEMMKGQYGEMSITVPAQTVNLGYQKLALVQTDISRISNVWYEQNGEPYELDEINSDEDWLAETDNHTNGDPQVYRDFEPDNTGTRYIQIWPGASAAWVANTNNGTLKFSYWAQLAQLSADGDIPNIPYELDTILVNGGLLEVGRMQGDSILMEIYEKKYEMDKAELRSWLIKQHARDMVIAPKTPIGVFGSNLQKQGYKIG